MELNVWVDGVPREVCLVDETTTAEEVIFALRDTLQMSGSFSLVAYWRGNEILLSPTEKPLNFINRLGANVKQFKFTLRRNEPPSQSRVSSVDSRVHSTLANPQVCGTPNPAINRKTTPALPMHISQSSPYAIHSPQNQFQNSLNHDKLREQVERQEQIVGLNRAQLSKLDKEIANLEAMLQLNSGSSRNGTPTIATTNGGCEAIGSLAELAQLSAVNWTVLLEEQRTKQRQLLAEREQHWAQLKALDEELAETRIKLTSQEAEVAQELTRLLSCLETAVSQRRALLASLTASSSSSQQISQSQAPANRDGIMI